jgi:hypothetical protein
MRTHGFRFGMRALLGFVAIAACAAMILREWYQALPEGPCCFGPYMRLSDGTITRFDRAWGSEGGFVVDTSPERSVKVIEGRIAVMKRLPSVPADTPVSKEERSVMGAVEVISTSNHPKAHRLLEQLLDDPSANVRDWVVWGLAQLGDKRALAILTRSITCEEMRSQHWNFVAAIAQFHDPQVVPVLLEESAKVPADLRIRHLVEFVEKLTGEPLRELYPEWENYVDSGRYGEVHQGLREWWDNNKARILRESNE